ncbi:LPS assembly lipoprotein LptE [Hoeflea sp. G2-23]|uniref:LPS assembly lipoprotein LptE n=1 Tax=Hoeflea algicola TaxID=2983763 RepID=A0ABT3ZB86_9HYPH|nr:LPS assembly lipoprotein LptE [Hoeflea algicola]MCY0149047.1 LPS assembly lipoprotein LptE [Hoeflea algicola]
MLSSERFGPGRTSGLVVLGLGLALLAGCQARPLYGTTGAQEQSVAVSPATSRVQRIVRNELVLGFGGEQTAAKYQLDLKVTAYTSGLLPGGVDNEFSAARTTVTANYVLKDASTSETIKSGSRFADAQLDLPSQSFAQTRARQEAEDRAAHSVAALVRADVAAALAQ